MSRDEEVLVQFSAEIEHGALILRDAASVGVHDSWQPESNPVQVLDDSVIFGVNVAVDGPVEVAVYRSRPERLGKFYFGADVSAASRRLVLSDPNEDVRFEFRLKSPVAHIEVYADSVDFPEFVQIVLAD